MKFTLLVTSPPTANLAVQHAAQFVQLASSAGHSIDNIFFYMDGVHNANAYMHPMNDEFNSHGAWCTIAKELRIPLLVCITAAERRGVIDKTLAKQNGSDGANLSAPFQQVGLSDFFERLHNVDRLVQF